MRYLGETIDIHGGGLENAFPHHESEIAQSEAATGKPFVKYWLHNNMVTVNGQKMGKSLGNFITLKDAFKKYPPLAIRYFILTSHYRSPLDFSEEAIGAAEKGLRRIHNAIGAVRTHIQRSPAASGGAVQDAEITASLDEFRVRYESSMDDDFNTPGAVAVISDMVRWTNTILSEKTLTRSALELIDGTYRSLGGDVLGIVTDKLLGEEAGGGLEPKLVELLIEMRNRLREEKNFDAADVVRKRLAEIGVELKDSPEGTTWSRRS